MSRLIHEEYSGPCLANLDLDKTYDTAASLLQDLEFGHDFPAWLKDAFLGAANCAIDRSARAVKRLAIDGALPTRLADFQAAHERREMSFSVLDLLVHEYFAPGRIANGTTREDIKHYDADLYAELEVHERIYGPLPQELSIPFDELEARATLRPTSGSPTGP